MISSSQRPLPDNTQQSQETDIHAPAGFEPTIPGRKWPKTHALDRAATGIGLIIIIIIIIIIIFIIIIIIIIIIIRESSSEREVEENGKAHETVTAPCFERLTQ